MPQISQKHYSDRHHISTYFLFVKLSTHQVSQIAWKHRFTYFCSHVRKLVHESLRIIFSLTGGPNINKSHNIYKKGKKWDFRREEINQSYGYHDKSKTRLAIKLLQFTDYRKMNMNTHKTHVLYTHYKQGSKMYFLKREYLVASNSYIGKSHHFWPKIYQLNSKFTSIWLVACSNFDSWL